MKQVTVLIVGGLIASLLLTQISMAQDQLVDPSSLEAMLKDVRIDGIGGIQPLPRRESDAIHRGAFPVIPVEWFEDFQDHPLSTDPVFDRFQVTPGQGQPDPTFFWEIFNGVNAIPSLFVDGQVDEFGTPDPLPRWQGIALIESLPGGLSDLNMDGAVDTADLGLLIADFGQTGSGLLADINSDGIVDTADLGLLIGVFGSSFGPFCVYEATLVYPIDDSGNPLPPGALDDGPFIGDRIAFTSSPACGTCDTFRLTTNGVRVFGEWALIDSAAADLTGVAFFGNETSAGCPDLGDERVLALVRGETGEVSPVNALNLRGSRVSDFAFNGQPQDLVCEVDLYLPSHEKLHWTDFVSDVEGLTVFRMLTGGIATDVSPAWEFFGNEDGLIDRFVILGSECGAPFCGSAGGLYHTAPDPDYIDPTPGTPTPTPLPGKKTLTGEWFTVRHVVTADNKHQVWVRDSETIALIDPLPGDDGGSTDSILDDIEDGFAKIFPSGPYGRTRREFFGGFPSSPAVPIATSATQFRSVFGYENGDLPRADRNHFVDNIRISGAAPIIAPPPLTLPYLDSCESYFIGPIKYGTTGGRWSESVDDETVVFPGEGAFGGEPSIVHTHASDIDDVYRTVFWTDLPDALAAPASPWRVGLLFKLNSTVTVRGITPMSTILGEAVTTVFTAVEEPHSDPGVVIFDTEPFDTRIHVRQRNPHFDPGSSADNWDYDWGPPAGVPGDPGYPNIEFINVATTSLIDEYFLFQLLEVEVADDGTLRVLLDGVELLPNDLDRFYDVTPGDITQFSTDVLRVDRLHFDSGFQSNSEDLEIDVDDITLTGQPAP